MIQITSTITHCNGIIVFRDYWMVLLKCNWFLKISIYYYLLMNYYSSLNKHYYTIVLKMCRLNIVYVNGGYDHKWKHVTPPHYLMQVYIIFLLKTNSKIRKACLIYTNKNIHQYYLSWLTTIISIPNFETSVN